MHQLPKVARADRIDPDLKSVFAPAPIVATPVLPKALKIALAWLMGLTLLFAMVPETRLDEAFSTALVFFIIGFAMFGVSRKMKRRNERAILQLDLGIAAHEPALRRNLVTAIKRNDYGATIADTRLAVATEFMDSIGIEKGALSPEAALARIEAQIAVQGQSQRARGFDPRDIPLDPVLFEHWVADQFTANGWDAEVTQGSGDQGIDVIARKAGNSVGIQCKLYSSNVGNAAVQQALAGVGYYGLTTAAVVSNAGFTASAKALAATTGVRLLSHYDLADPDRALGL